SDGEPDPRRRDPQLPLDLRGLVAMLRHEVLVPQLTESPTAEQRAAAEQAARHLARLAAAGARGADPDSWSGIAPVSTEPARYRRESLAHLSPSRVESLSRCSLRWALEAAGGTALGTFASQLGSLVHEIAEALPTGTREEMRAELDRLWPGLDLPDGWLTER